MNEDDIVFHVVKEHSWYILMKLVRRSRTKNPNEYIYLYDKLFLIFFQRRDGTPHFFRGNILHQSRDTMLEEKRKAHMLQFGE